MNDRRTAVLGDHIDIPGLLADAALRTPDRPYVTFDGVEVTVAQLNARVGQVADELAGRSVGPGARVAVALENSVDHLTVVLALFRLDAVWVPVNVRLRGDPLAHVLENSAATHAIGAGLPAAEAWPLASLALDVRLSTVEYGRAHTPLAPGTRAIMHTSGTTGPAKGVQVTDLMLRAAALGCLEVTGPVDGDVLYMWEPMVHIGGAQVVLVPLLADVTIAMAPGFSASRFWPEVIRSGATHIHYLGGILQILLKRPPSAMEREHRVRVAWGAGAATTAVWEACRERFGVAVHECYGQTETSSIATVNRRGPEHGIGFPLPWFEVDVDAGSSGPQQPGEIVVRERLPGLVTPGYLGSQAAPSGSLWRTGDLGARGPAGQLRFLGRLTDSMRVRGENVSAFEVENAFAEHPSVAQCAVVGVPSDFGEQDIMLFVVQAADAADLAAPDLISWADGRLADFQRPRYVKVLRELPLTPSRRAAKGRLDTSIADAVDLRTPDSAGR